MAFSFLNRLIGRKKRGERIHVRNVFKAEVRPSEIADHEEREGIQSGPTAKNTGLTPNVNSLFAFVDPKDPFTPGEIAGEQLPGPILSIMSAKEFRNLFLFHTPHTREHAVATEREVSRRYPECKIVVNELHVSDPKDYSAVMGRLAWTVRRLIKLRKSEIADCYVCVSSGTAEMRAAWFLLAALGVLPAKMLQVGSPARPLFGEANVREVRTDSSDWLTIRDLAMPNEYFLANVAWNSKPVEARRPFSWLWREIKGADEAPLIKKPEPGEQMVGSDTAFVKRMRMLYGDPLTEFLLPPLHDKLKSRNLSPDVIRALTEEAIGRLAPFLRARGHGGTRRPSLIAGLADSVINNLYLEYCRSNAQTQPNQPIGEFHCEPLDLAKDLKLTPEQLDTLERGMPELDKRAEQSLLEAEEVLEALVRGGRIRPETLGPKNEAIDEAPTEKTPLQGGDETQEIALGGDREFETHESQGGPLEAAPEKPTAALPDGGRGEKNLRSLASPRNRKESRVGNPFERVESYGVAREVIAVPGLDDALLELGIFIGSAALRHAAEQAGIAAGSHLPILLLGETGTGKDRFAHLIHMLSPRFRHELVAVNCAAIPASLAESYVLGHIKGAFTGATSDGKGIFEAADQGTLFLDEIAELTLEVQAKLLRVINDGVVQRLGSTVSRKVDVRIIAASNRDLRKEVSVGRFREDLYFRLEVVQIRLPALRERRGEIPELALMLLRRINQLREKPRRLTTAALARLERQPWPGNVRDLLNVLERSVLYSSTEVIDADDLRFNRDPQWKDPFAGLPEPSDGFNVEEYLRQARNQLFLQALEACKGNQTAAAEMLGVSKQAVSKFVQKNDNEN